MVSYRERKSLGAALLIICCYGALSIDMAQAGIVQVSDDFESQTHRDWFITEKAGFDLNKSLAYKGNGNAWVRTTTGWNAVNTIHPFSNIKPGEECDASAWLRMSPDVSVRWESLIP